MKQNKIIVYGYGNPGRQDDGLGPVLIERLEAEQITGVELDSNYQLNIEDAYEIAEAKVVIFVDASLDCKEPFEFNRLDPETTITFTTHSMAPGSVLALCQEVFNREVEAWLMAIRGYEWEFDVPMTEKAANNCEAACSFIKDKLNGLLE